MKHIFLLSILFKSHLIRYSGTGRAFKDTLRALEHLRHSESTGALGHSESTRRALGHLMHLGTRTIIAHGHLEGTWELGGHSGTRRALKALRHSRHSGTRGTWALEAIYLADSNFPQFHEHIFRSSRCRRSSKYVLLKISQYLELKSDSNTGVFL